LTAEGATGMGQMFKVVALSDSRLTSVPGFDGWRPRSALE
jgi:hypothetical protein